MKQKRIRALVLAVLLFALALAPQAAATELAASEIAAYEAETKDLITQEVAEIIAGYFIDDCVNAGMAVNWTSNTAIAKNVPMYDEAGLPSAYSFELTTNGGYNGYIVVSAYPDLEHPILEYADEAPPVYEALDATASQKIVYTGPMEYYKDIGNQKLMDTRKEVVNRKDVTNSFKPLRSEKNHWRNEAAAKNSAAADGLAGMENEAGAYDVVNITDPTAHANANYQGPFVNYEWRNDFENYCKFRQQKNYYDSNYNCAPVAMANVLEMMGTRYNIKKITTYYTHTSIVNTCMTQVNGLYVERLGVAQGNMKNYLEKAYSHFASDYSIYSVKSTYDNIKSNINLNRTFIIDVFGNNLYNDAYHAVTAYAYCRLRSTSTGYYASYVKIADGINSSGRYLTISSIQNCNMYYASVRTW